MPIIKKFSPFQNLASFNTLFLEGVSLSNYLRITDFPDTFTGGKNAFLIEGSEHLQPGTEVKLEILDVNGIPIYYEPGNGIPEYYEGISKVVSIHVYDDTPIGICDVTILAELKTYIDEQGEVREVPDEWKGRYNLKWQRQVQVNKKLANETKVRFYRRPKVTIEELVKPIFTKSFPTVTQTGSVSGFAELPSEGTDLDDYQAGTLYRLARTEGPNFTQSIDEDIINIPSLNYSARIREVLNDAEVLVEVPYTENNIIKNFDSQGYTSSFVYTEASDTFKSAITGSFGKIRINDLKTFAGDVARLRIYRKSRSQVGDFELSQDIKLESRELLLDVDTPLDTQIPYGNLTEDNINNYWVSSSNDHPISVDTAVLYNSAKVDYDENIGGVQQLITSESLNFSKNVEYTLNYKARLTGSLSSNKSIRTYISSSDFIQEFSILKGSPVLNTRQNISQNIISEYSGSAKLVFEFEGDGWYVSNLSLRNAQDTSFSPDEVTLIQSIPRKLSTETFDFVFEFYDINNNFIPVNVTATKEFDGGNDSTVDRLQKFLRFDSDRTAFRFTTGSVGNPPFQQIGFSVSRNLLTGSVTYISQAFDREGNALTDGDYSGGQYPGLLTNAGDEGATLTIGNFTGSRSDILVGSIIYTASLEDFEEHETIYRLEDGENAPGLFTSTNTNQFIYEPTELRPKPSTQEVRIQAERKNLASATSPIEVNSGSGSPPLTEGTDTNGIKRYSITATAFSASYGGMTGQFPEVTYEFTSSDQFNNEFTDAVTVSPVINFDGVSIVLSNESTAFSADSTGLVTPSGYDEGDGIVNVNVYDKSIQHSEGLTERNRFDIISVSGTNVTPNSTSPNTNSYGIQNMTSDAGSLDLTIDYLAGDNATTARFLKKVNYTKARAAAPVISIQTSNKDQSLTADSQGKQLGNFQNSLVTVLETYLGTTTSKTITSLTAVRQDTSNPVSTSTIPGDPVTINLSGETLANSTGSTLVEITAQITDSEGQTREVTDTISLSKVRNSQPTLTLSISPQGQTVSAKSNGEQLDTFEDATVVVQETYLGTTSQVVIDTLTAERRDTSTNLTTTTATGNIDLSPITLADGVNGTIVDVTVEVTDTEGTTREITGTLSLSKVKNSAPNVLITASPQAQTVAADRDGNQTGTLLDVFVSAEEGNNDVFDSMTVSGSGFESPISTSGKQILLSDAIISGSDSASATAIVNYTNSEGISYSGSIIVSATLSVEGDLGVTGPGVVARGEYDNTISYQFSSTFPGRRDAVKYQSRYYATLQPTTGNAPTGLNSDNTWWQFLGTEELFVAAKIIISENSFVKEVLNIGTNPEGDTANITLDGSGFSPYLSLGQSPVGVYDADGIFLGQDGLFGKFSIKDGTNGLSWDGQTLNVTGDITVTNTNDFAPVNAEPNPSDWSFGPDGAGLITLSALTPSGAGLYLGSNYLGYYSGGQWQTYMAANGDFFLKGGSSGGLEWDASLSTLTVTGEIRALSGDLVGALTVNNGQMKIGTDAGGGGYHGIDLGTGVDYWYDSGDFSAGNGNIVWDGSTLSIGGGATFAGNLSAAGGTFEGTLSAPDGNIGGWTIDSDEIKRTVGAEIHIGNNLSGYQSTPGGQQLLVGYSGLGSVPYVRAQSDKDNYVQMVAPLDPSNPFFTIVANGEDVLSVTETAFTVGNTTDYLKFDVSTPGSTFLDIKTNTFNLSSDLMAIGHNAVVPSSNELVLVGLSDWQKTHTSGSPLQATTLRGSTGTISPGANHTVYFKAKITDISMSSSFGTVSIWLEKNGVVVKRNTYSFNPSTTDDIPEFLMVTSTDGGSETFKVYASYDFTLSDGFDPFTFTIDFTSNLIVEDPPIGLNGDGLFTRVAGIVVPFVSLVGSSGGGGGSISSINWGDIGGTLASQTDLQDALDAKLDKAGGTLTGFLTLDSDPNNALHAATKQYVDNSGEIYTAGQGIALSSNEFSVAGGTGLTATSTGLSITSGGVTATQLAVTGDGTTSQYLRSDGDGTFTWATPPDTIYTHPTYTGDDINIDTTALTGATVISDLDFNITTNTLGHVTDANGVVSTRTLTPADIGAATDTHTHTEYVDLTSTETITGQKRFSNATTYFGTTTSNTAEIWMQTGNAGSPQIGLTDNQGDVSWAVGVDDGDNNFKIDGSATGTIPTINNLTSPLFEVTTTGNLIVQGTFSATGYNNDNWNTAYGWGKYEWILNTSSGDTANLTVTKDKVISFNGSGATSVARSGDTITISSAEGITYKGGVGITITGTTNPRTISFNVGTGLEQVTGGNINVKYGTALGTAVQGNDSRLNDLHNPGLSGHLWADQNLRKQDPVQFERLGVGTDPPVVNGSWIASISGADADQGALYIGGGTTKGNIFAEGTITSDGISYASDHRSGSDKRIKKIHKTGSGLKFIEGLTLYNFTKRGAVGKQWGVIAQELQKNDKDLVGTMKDDEFGELLNVSALSLASVSAVAVKELHEKLKKALKEIEYLKNKIDK